MSRTVVVVLDGLGIGAMPDAGGLRAGDVRADTLGHTLDRCRRDGRPLRLPALGSLGLGLLCPHPDLADRTDLPVAVGRAALGYPGADTYAGHQTLAGADFSGVAVTRLGERQAEVTEALRAAGHRVAPLAGAALLEVDGRMLVHDNLEADPGINWNVSGRLTEVSFEEVLAVARTVRAVAPVARVIAVAGHSDRPLAASVRDGDGGTVGLDTPATGFYRNGGLRVRHLGVPLDPTRQLPEAAARAGVPVTLAGKAADLFACRTALRRPAVATDEVMAHTLEAVRNHTTGRALVIANVQETDLAGHQQEPLRFGAVLERADAGLGRVIEALDRPGDLLLITGDHGNDPTIGHPYHTREYVPVLMRRHGAEGTVRLPDTGSLADLGATAAEALGLPERALGQGVPLRWEPVPAAGRRGPEPGHGPGDARLPRAGA